jgi:antitoxin component of RelBE/YafQ-DinJ toxin-antitoxin module
MPKIGHSDKKRLMNIRSDKEMLKRVDGYLNEVGLDRSKFLNTMMMIIGDEKERESEEMKPWIEKLKAYAIKEARKDNTSK